MSNFFTQLKQEKGVKIHVNLLEIYFILNYVYRCIFYVDMCT